MSEITEQELHELQDRKILIRLQYAKIGVAAHRIEMANMLLDLDEISDAIKSVQIDIEARLEKMKDG